MCSVIILTMYTYEGNINFNICFNFIITLCLKNALEPFIKESLNSSSFPLWVACQGGTLLL